MEAFVLFAFVGGALAAMPLICLEDHKHRG
jgi:hypothetical protein